MKQKAFTLIEVVVALAVIAIALSAITFNINQSIKTQQHIKTLRIQYLQQDNRYDEKAG